MNHGTSGSNGDMPLDAIESARVTLTKAAANAAEQRDALKEAYDEAQALVARYERALRGLEPPAPKVPKAKAQRAATEQQKVRDARRGPNGDPSITQAASGYPAVSEAKQEQVLAVLRSMGEPGPVGAIVEAGAGEVSKGTVSSALAHLRARGLVRWSGKAQGGGHKYAPYDWTPGDLEAVAGAEGDE
jgi:hypothetical protein